MTLRREVGAPVDNPDNPDNGAETIETNGHAAPSALVPGAGSVTMFTTSWCGYCARLKSQLTREGVPFTEIDIERHPEHVELVERVNGGNRTVPTVLFPDGSAATNPSLAQVHDRLAG